MANPTIFTITINATIPMAIVFGSISIPPSLVSEVTPSIPAWVVGIDTLLLFQDMTEYMESRL